MGLLTLPFRGLLWIVEEVVAETERALYDEDALRAQLVTLYAELEAGAIGEEEFARREERLALHLTEAEEHNRGVVEPVEARRVG